MEKLNEEIEKYINEQNSKLPTNASLIQKSFVYEEIISMLKKTIETLEQRLVKQKYIFIWATNNKKKSWVRFVSSDNIIFYPALKEHRDMKITDFKYVYSFDNIKHGNLRKEFSDKNIPNYQKDNNPK